jgi:hypothetical protein
MDIEITYIIYKRLIYNCQRLFGSFLGLLRFITTKFGHFILAKLAQ